VMDLKRLRKTERRMGSIVSLGIANREMAYVRREV
jgi:hypothetical protein